MKSPMRGGDAIRLTNKTARALREQARQQRFALHMTATVLTVVLAAFAIVMGIQHIIYVPVTVLAIILIDALIILLAQGRYISLTGQAICTEAAARQMRGESAESIRVKTAKRDLEKIKEDLASSGKAAKAVDAEEEEEEEEDDDLSLPLPIRKPAEKPAPLNIPLEETHVLEKAASDSTLVIPPVTQRRRRQGHLQVLSSEKTE